MTRALFAGSFDPFTNGHLDVLRDAMACFDTVIVAVGTHATKNAMLSVETRLGLIRDVADGLPGAVETTTFEDLLVDAARRERADVLVRGLRDGTDLDYELQLAGMNRGMAPALPTVLLPPRAGTRHVTGTLVRQIAKMGGDVSPFVPPATLAALRENAK